MTKRNKNMVQLSASQRYEIGTLKGWAWGPTEIMKHTGIDKSVVSRELNRNGKAGVYEAARAHKMCAPRRRRGLCKIKGAVKEDVDKMLGQQVQPRADSGPPCGGGPSQRVSHESIYQYICRDRARGRIAQKLAFWTQKAAEAAGSEG